MLVLLMRFFLKNLSKSLEFVLIQLGATILQIFAFLSMYFTEYFKFFVFLLYVFYFVIEFIHVMKYLIELLDFLPKLPHNKTKQMPL